MYLGRLDMNDENLGLVRVATNQIDNVKNLCVTLHTMWHSINFLGSNRPAWTLLSQSFGAMDGELSDRLEVLESSASVRWSRVAVGQTLERAAGQLPPDGNETDMQRRSHVASLYNEMKKNGSRLKTLLIIRSSLQN